MLHELDGASPSGCAIALHIHFTTPHYLFQSYPEGWREHYSASGLVVQDPTVAWGMNNTGWICWGDLVRIDEHGVLERAKQFGIMNGVTISVLLEGSRSIASFARADRDYEVSEIAELEATFVELHLATARLEPVSKADREALKKLSIQLTH